MPKNKLKEVKQTIAFRPTPKVFKLLEEAQQVTGSDRSTILEACIEAAIDGVIVKEVKRKQDEAARALEALKQHKKKP